MTGRLPKDEAGVWQLVPFDNNRQCSSAISVIVEKLLTLVCAHAHQLVIFSFQEARSWTVPELQLPGYVCHGGKLGLARLVVSDQFFKIVRSLDVRRGMCCRSLWSRFCDGRVRSGLPEKIGCF